jgi:hypothetical protein
LSWIVSARKRSIVPYFRRNAHTPEQAGVLERCNAISPYWYRPTAVTDPGLDPAATVEGDRGVKAPFKPMAYWVIPALLRSAT